MSYYKKPGSRPRYPSTRGRKRKVRWGRVALLVFILAAIIAGIVLLINLLTGGSKKVPNAQGADPSSAVTSPLPGAEGDAEST